MPDWVEHAIWWHVYPLGLLGADTTGVDRSPTHRLRGLEPWLDHVVRLGTNGIALGPVFASASHGYDTIDHFRIDPRLGDQDDFVRLLRAAHERGLRVLLDGVFNHVGREFPAFQRASADPSGPDARWFRPAGKGRFANFEGHDTLVTLNHGEPAVADYVVDVMNHWLAAGADGWRLDAAYAVPTAFWAGVLPRVRQAHPECYVVGEVLHGDYPAIVRDAGLDSVTQYELWKAIWSSIDDGNFFELAWALKRHGEFLSSFVPFTFVGNHDVTRLASQIADSRHVAHAVVVLFTVGGTPAVYYGDEWGMHGVKEERVGGDDAVRPALPGPPSELDLVAAGFLRLHQDLIGLRRRHPWLHQATTQDVELTNTAYVYRSTAAENSITVALNIGDEPLEVALATGASAVQLLAGSAAANGHVWTVEEHAWAVLG